MADLSDLQSAQSVKIIGSDATGVESTPVKSTTNGELQTSDILDNAVGTQGALTVSTTAVEIKVGVSRVSNRKLVSLYNNSTTTMYWGFTSAVTTDTGTPIQPNEYWSWAVGGSQPLYVITTAGSLNARVTES